MICDMGHRAIRLFHSKILKKGDKMAKIVFDDKVILSMEIQQPKQFAILRDGQLDWNQFMDKFMFIWENKSILDLVIHHCQCEIALIRTYTEEYRQEIMDKLKINSPQWHFCRKIITIGFAHLAPHQFPYYVLLILGYQTPEQLTKTNIIPNGQYVLDLNDPNNKKLYRQNIPKWKAPCSFVLRIMKKLGFDWDIHYKDLIQPGFHSLTQQIEATKSYFRLC